MLARNRLLMVVGLILTSCTSNERDVARMNTKTAVADTSNPALYRVSPGDTLRIDFSYNEELNRVVIVRPDGYISLPYVDDIRVADKTIPEVRGRLAELYTGTLKDPQVTIYLENLGSFKVYVGGEVVSPGVFALTDGVTTLRAIAMAGGTKEKAGLDSVVVIRDQGTPVPQYLFVNVRRAIAGLDATEDIRLRSKDIVFVPKSTIGTIDQFVDQYINQLIPFSKSLGLSYSAGPGIR